MKLRWTDVPPAVRGLLEQGAVLPAHPLALDAKRQLDPRRQRALSRYYIDAGAGGIAVGVHATQFAIRDVGLYEPVLRLAAETASNWAVQPLVMIAGVVGRTDQACREATLARALGYHAVLLGLGAMKGASEDELIAHCRRVADEMPVIGFYLQAAVGGIRLSADFWRRFAEIENVVAIKVAPFNRYATLDVVRGVINARAEDRVALYTGNDDHIVLDLCLPFAARRNREEIRVNFRGGLLGHWSVWTSRASEILERAKAARKAAFVEADLLALDAAVTDMNAAVFDVANNFAGCIAGCHEVLRRQGLLEGIWCLDPAETLGPGQAAELDRAIATYPELTDDEFVAANLDRWLA